MKDSISCYPLLLILLVNSPSGRSDPCTLCQDGTKVTLPDKMVVIPPIPAVKCIEAEGAIPIIFPDETSSECQLINEISTFCGCPRAADSCSLCPDGSPVTNKNVELPMFNPVFGDTVLTCEIMEAYLHSFPENDGFCPYSQQNAAELCGCPRLVDNEGDDGSTRVPPHTSNSNSTIVGDIDVSPQPTAPSFNLKLVRINFHGATSGKELRRLATIIRISASLSIAGALLVIQDNLRDKKRRKNQYNQIVTLMAVFDIIHAIATALVDLPRPTGDVLRTSGEMGNEASCKSQGFFIQWGGLTSLFFSASLSTYYLLVIVYRSRESRLKMLQKYFTGVPILLGSILASVSIPFITPSLSGCNLPPPNIPFFEDLEIADFSSSWAPYLALYIIPGFLVLTFATLAMLHVYLYIRKINKKARRWRMSPHATSLAVTDGTPPRRERQGRITFNRTDQANSRHNNVRNIQREVSWQSALYLLALYLTWFVHLCVALNLEKIVTSHYALWAFTFFITGLQGFLNSLVYMRPRLIRMWSKFQKQRRMRNRNGTPSTASTANNSGDTTNNSSSGLVPWSAIQAVEPAAALAEMNEEDDTKEEAAAVSGNDDFGQAALQVPELLNGDRASAAGVGETLVLDDLEASDH